MQRFMTINQVFLEENLSRDKIAKDRVLKSWDFGL